ncbi:MAG TPA: 3' terminal RNA ribose 2'-O-methyltransferase Hen1 [Geminicoccaceae bacterium]|nr:3' terminal RNA ribose 2'-O-methyltransferase Hen1 [Geminicoccus sp.]HMU50108.1 3' terminal RNA ribose 2'-O-methyltransferase Hen1 [Geminicoccaceae bacterium]
MFLSIATTHQPASDLGYLLMKHPDRVHEFDLAFGKALVFYPEASARRCEAALVLDIDPVGLVRGRGSSEGLLDQYVNDRPYAASSLLSVALNRAFRTAMTGASRERPELAAMAIPLELRVLPLPARGGDDFVRALFEPLGWDVGIERIHGAGGMSRYVALSLSGNHRVADALSHLYVLIPVLDDDKHYWVGDDEVEKLLAKGGDWLAGHPEKEMIAHRYLKHRRSLARAALARLAPEEAEESEPETAPRDAAEEALEKPLRLHTQRLDVVTEALAAAGARTVADLGCGEGKLLARLVRDRRFACLIGLDASARSLEHAAERLKLDRAGGPSERVTLLHGALTYRDERWKDADAVALVEVIEHLNPDRLPALARVVFGEARPKTVVVTTPNAEHNRLFPDLPPGRFRHPDHRFEWSRSEFGTWVAGIEEHFGYTATISGIGAHHEEFGAPTQMAVFVR